MKIIRFAVHAILFAAITLPAAPQAETKTVQHALPTLHVDAARVAVIGFSAGAYMAAQAQLAYPEVFRGAALVAGGPYDCAQGNLATAVATCMQGKPAPDGVALAKAAQALAAKGKIGPLDKLAGEKVYILHGKRDPVIAESVAHATVDFYEALKAAVPALASLTVTWDGAHDFSHTFPTVAAGGDCNTVGTPYIGKCGFDAAGAIFHALYGKPPRKTGAAKGELRRFDQDALRPSGTDAFLASSGVIYVPRACNKGFRCGILVALHGCQQNLDSVGEAFVRDAGLNHWADVYNVAVLYPQTRSGVAANPKACWDWFGYSGAKYATRDGVQLRWLVAAVTALERHRPDVSD
ncbi:MAG: extracellular catalytic domain type 2 short-chain-length polyhydroxyalkanoate depolymerase [Rudaea sp.]